MADGVKPRVKAPKSASAGEVVTIKTLISHKMESGQRKNKDGSVIPRSIINRFTCEFNGEMVVDVTLEPAISTNPYFEFFATVPETGEFKFTWYDDDGSVYEDSKAITVGATSTLCTACSPCSRHSSHVFLCEEPVDSPRMSHASLATTVGGSATCSGR